MPARDRVLLLLGRRGGGRCRRSSSRSSAVATAAQARSSASGCASDGGGVASVHASGRTTRIVKRLREDRCAMRCGWRQTGPRKPPARGALAAREEELLRAPRGERRARGGRPLDVRHDHGDGTATSLCSGSVAGARMGSGFWTGTFGSAAVCATASTSGSSTSAATRRSILNSSPSADAAGGATRTRRGHRRRAGAVVVGGGLPLVPDVAADEREVERAGARRGWRTGTSRARRACPSPSRSRRRAVGASARRSDAACRVPLYVQPRRRALHRAAAGSAPRRRARRWRRRARAAAAPGPCARRGRRCRPTT